VVVFIGTFALSLLLSLIASYFIRTRLKTKISEMEAHLSPKDQDAVRRLDKPLKTFTKISSIITAAIITIPVIFIIYLLAMFFLTPR